MKENRIMKLGHIFHNFHHNKCGNKKIGPFNKGILFTTIILLLFMTNLAIYNVFPDYRNSLERTLHLGSGSTHYIGDSVNNHGITLTVVASHVGESTGVLLFSFTKVNGNEFRNSLNPDTLKITFDNKKVSYSGCYTELSDDSKRLYCYYTWHFTSHVTNHTMAISIHDLICNQSQVEGFTYTDSRIPGEWRLDLKLSKDIDNSAKIYNKNMTDTITMFGKQYQIDSILLSNMLLIVDTTVTDNDSSASVISGNLGRKNSLLSNIYPRSGAYYNVYIRLEYRDGTFSDYKNSLIDNDGNMIAWFPETINIKEVVKIYVGDVIVSV